VPVERHPAGDLGPSEAHGIQPARLAPVLAHASTILLRPYLVNPSEPS
jgi:hypothetical protein